MLPVILFLAPELDLLLFDVRESLITVRHGYRFNHLIPHSAAEFLQKKDQNCFRLLKAGTYNSTLFIHPINNIIDILHLIVTLFSLYQHVDLVDGSRCCLGSRYIVVRLSLLLLNSDLYGPH